MNRIIRKYKDRDIKIQSSRKIVAIKWILFCTVIIMIIWTNILITSSSVETKSLHAILILMITLLCIDLYQTDWLLKTKENILIVRKWIFKYKIPFRELIDIEDKWWWHDNLKRNFLEIKYKKGNNIKNIQIDYLIKVPFIKWEYAKKSEVTELINIFFKGGELIEDREETNLLLSEYKDIRTEQEEKEIDDLLNKKQKIEEKVIWILICVLVIGFISFIWFIFNL